METINHAQLAPEYRCWDFFSDLTIEDHTAMEFRLIYQGLLKATGNRAGTEHKHAIRRYFHKQLVNLWKTKYPLRSFYEGKFTPSIESLAKKHSLGNKRYVPIVRRSFDLHCKLDILLLRRDLGTIISSGDLDNRIKTLIDALRIPVVGENSDGPEDPLYCLMEDDQLISEVKVVGDHLFAEPDQIIENPKSLPSGDYAISKGHVCAVIHVTVGADRYSTASKHFR